MLTYLGTALPQFTSPAARLLALQCALRADTRGHVRLPTGLLRGMRLRQSRELWLELAHAGWLGLPDFRTLPVQALLLDTAVLDQAPGRRVRRRGADWALRPRPLLLPVAAPALRLTALVLAAHTCARGEHSTDMDILARLCGHSPQQTGELLDRLVTTHTSVIAVLPGWERRAPRRPEARERGRARLCVHGGGEGATRDGRDAGRMKLALHYVNDLCAR
ncbi:hypothetical protein [Streptomyces lanatus]|uniref:Uncharacterized protein n=1 Tax=Streptomyces lanatus TaxID=66900 RepID=A0ABV1Y611_9ACTN|nr:hypothetical protein [Streptomyces lanatus]GHH30406.1 hypothetical protein GCM10018780_89800 [Streptomyces lanatus]